MLDVELDGKQGGGHSTWRRWAGNGPFVRGTPSPPGASLGYLEVLSHIYLRCNLSGKLDHKHLLSWSLLSFCCMGLLSVPNSLLELDSPSHGSSRAVESRSARSVLMSPCVYFHHASGTFILWCMPTQPPTTLLSSLLPRNPSLLPLSHCLPDIQHDDVGPVPSFKEPRDPGCIA